MEISSVYESKMWMINLTFTIMYTMYYTTYISAISFLIKTLRQGNAGVCRKISKKAMKNTGKSHLAKITWTPYNPVTTTNFNKENEGQRAQLILVFSFKENIRVSTENIFSSGN